MKVGATAETEAKWAERVRRWRASGEHAGPFAAREGYAEGTLRWWASRLGHSAVSLAPVEGAPRFLRVVPPPAASKPSTGLVVEVGRARVRVEAGFDAELLGEVVAALGGTR